MSEERCITLELLAGERGQRASDLDFYLISHAIPYDSTRQLVPWAVAIKLLPEGSIVRRSLTALEQMAEVEA